jgi:hypothetical protein
MALERGERNLKIWDIGSGVLEPLLIGALCELYKDLGMLENYEIICLDRSTDVHNILTALKNKTAYEIKDKTLVNSQGKLILPGLAYVFSATTAAINSLLTSPIILSAHLQRWIDLGIGPYCGIPTDVCLSEDKLKSFILTGLTINPSILSKIRPLLGDVSRVSSFQMTQKWANVVISNYAIQYPLWDGREQEVIETIENHTTADAVKQVSNAYSGQQLLIESIDKYGRYLADSNIEIALQEIFVVEQYHDDSPASSPRLVPRVDMFFYPDNTFLTDNKRSIVQNFTNNKGGETFQFDSLKALSQIMETHTGLSGEGLMVYYAHWDGKQRKGQGYLLKNNILLPYGRMPFRVGMSW